MLTLPNECDDDKILAALNGVINFQCGEAECEEIKNCDECALKNVQSFLNYINGDMK